VSVQWWMGYATGAASAVCTSLFVVAGVAGLIKWRPPAESARPPAEPGPCGEIGHPDAAHFCRYPDGTPAPPRR
jgi:hypothetical protein